MNKPLKIILLVLAALVLLVVGYLAIFSTPENV